jgi:ATP-binding protein involved in chromosome partitioning
VLAAITMTVGNVIALVQTNLRRLLACSSIAHAGYLLTGIAVAAAAASVNAAGGRDAVAADATWLAGLGGATATLFYLATYALATIGIFAAIAYLGHRWPEWTSGSGPRPPRQEITSVEDLDGLSGTNPVAAFAIAVFLLSLAGIPPLPGFWGKLTLATSALEVDWNAPITFGSRRAAFIALAVILVLNAAIAAAYYLRIIAAMYFRSTKAPACRPTAAWLPALRCSPASCSSGSSRSSARASSHIGRGGRRRLRTPWSRRPMRPSRLLARWPRSDEHDSRSRDRPLRPCRLPDPESGRSLAEMGQLGAIDASPAAIRVSIALTTHSAVLWKQVRGRIEERLRTRFPQVPAVEVTITPTTAPRQARPDRPRSQERDRGGQRQGGVGRSTIAASIAIGLARAARSACSMPTSMARACRTSSASSGRPQIENGKIVPMRLMVGSGSMPVMSMGFLVPPGEAVVWPRPDAPPPISQMLRDTLWGPLDYLIIDMPPGAGGIALTLSQVLPLTAAVIVCTPQDVALLDATKAIAMFRKVNIPLLGMVENMSFFVCPDTQKRYDIFGTGGANAHGQGTRHPVPGRSADPDPDPRAWRRRPDRQLRRSDRLMFRMYFVQLRIAVMVKNRFTLARGRVGLPS